MGNAVEVSLPFDPDTYEGDSNDLFAPVRFAGIYFLHAPIVQRVKIGWSQDVFKRVMELTTGCPEPLVLRFVLALPREAERALHEQFDVLRQHLEWFDESVLQLLDESLPKVGGVSDIEFAGSVRDKLMFLSWGRTYSS